MVSSLDVDDAAIYTIEHAVDARGRRIEIKEFAELVGLDKSVIYDILNRRRNVRASEVARFARVANTNVLPDAIERVLGRVGVPLPVMCLNGDQTVRRAEVALREFGELIAQVGAAQADGNVTAGEAARVREEAEEVHAAVHALVQQIESTVPKSAKGSAR